MKKVIAVRPHNRGMVQYYNPGELELVNGSEVVLDSSHGPQYAVCSGYPSEVNDDFAGEEPLPEILRLVTEEDLEQYEENIKEEKEAFGICLELIVKHELEMALVEVEYTLDRSKLIFYFTADGRVDFRELVKDLASTFRTRIELRQIGVRDEASMRGGLGICGRALCCATFMQEFHPVSIKMAKEQNLAMNPNKISGACGRLLCCLRYEEEAYIDAKKRLPKEGTWVQTPEGNGVIQEVNLLKETVKVLLDKGDEQNLVIVPAADVQAIRRDKRKRG